MATAALSPSEARQVKFTVTVILRCAILTHGSRVEVRTANSASACGFRRDRSPRMQRGPARRSQGL